LVPTGPVAKAVHPPLTRRPLQRTEKKSHNLSEERPFVLWTEGPTLAIGDWPSYFEKLLSFVNDNCLNVKVTRLVMRVLNPQFQNERGLLWQFINEACFWKDFMQHLPPSVKLFFLPVFV
jgi:hypothetical protein